LGCRGDYGRIGIRGYKGGAHRASYRAFKGEIPRGLNVLHRCDVPLCVNPNHLFLGTSADNTEDMIAKGRGAKRVGELNTQAKLTPEAIADIRHRIAAKQPHREIAAIHGVSEPTISDIKKGRSWAHVGQ
jgi:hypothetical protein